MLGTKNPVSACPPSEVTATLTAAAIRREVASLRIAAAARVAVTSEGGHAETGFLVPNKKAPRNPATASGEMASPRSMLADVGRLAAVLTRHRSPPAPGALWGHAPPTWRPGGRTGAQTTLIRPLAGSEALVGARPVWPHTTHPRNRGGYGRSSRPQGPFGITGVAWGMSVCPREREKAYSSKYPRNRLG